MSTKQNFRLSTCCGFVKVIDSSRSCVLLSARDIGNARERGAVVVEALNARAEELLSILWINERQIAARRIARAAVGAI